VDHTAQLINAAAAGSAAAVALNNPYLVAADVEKALNDQIEPVPAN
jgi:thioredoxin reductase (NADPH)